MPRLTSVPLNPARNRALFAQERKQDSGLDAFIKSLARYPTLTPSESRHLALKAQMGDTAARDKLVECHLRLVVSIALPYINRGVPLMDLIQEGSIGLIRAIEKYDPDRTARFSTHASWWILDGVHKAVLTQSNTIRVPNHVQAQAARVRTTESIAAAVGETLSDDELSTRAGVSPEHLQRVRTAAKMRPLSLDYETADGRPFGETLGLSYSQSLYEQAVEDERIETLYRHLRACLTSTEREIVYQRFGLQHAYREHSFEEIAAEMGLSRRQVKREYERAIVKLRAAYGVSESLVAA